MSTYYKYAERDVANEINWAVIGKNFTDMLKTEKETRDKRKADIDKATTETLQTMADVPVAEHAGLAQRVLDFGAQGTQQLQMLDRLLKSGQISPDQFIKNRENLLSGTKDGFGFVKEMDQLWKSRMERRDKGESSNVEQEIMALAEGFGDFSNMKFAINSADGTVMLAMGKKDPATGQVVIDESPDKLVPMATMRKRLRQTVDKVDVNKEAEGLAKVLGEEVRVIKKGGVLTLSDAMKKPEYIKAESDYIKGALSDPLKVASILTDVVKVDKNGNPYSVTFDPKIASSDPSKVLLIADPSNPSSGRFTASIDMNSDAYKQAEAALRDRVRVMIDKEETATPIFAPTPRSSGGGDGGNAKSEGEIATMIARVYYGNQSEIDSSLEYFTGLIPGIKELEKKDGNLIIKYDNGDERTIGIQGKTIEDFVRGTTALTGIKDINTALRSAQIPKGATYNPLGGKSVKTSTALAKAGTPIEAWKAKVTEAIPLKIQDDNGQYIDFTISKNEGDAVSDLQPLTVFGFRVDEAVPGTDAVEIVSPDGNKRATFRTLEKGVTSKIRTWVENALSQSELSKLAESGVIEVSAAAYNKQ